MSSEHPACLWHCEDSWGAEVIDKGYLTRTCPRAGFYGFSIYRTVKHSIIYASELTQLCWAGNLLFLFIAVGVELLLCKDSGCCRAWLAGAGTKPSVPV